MPVTVSINGLSAVHKGSNGMATATAPDVCLTPGPSGPIPVPYPNIAMSADLVSGTTSVKLDGVSAAIQGSKFVKSSGDQAGSAGGVMSGVFGMEATFISFSPTVMLDGKPACRLTDKLLMNKTNTVCMGGELQGPVPPAPPAAPGTAPAASPAPEAPKKCVVRSILVKCGHGSRNLQLDLAKHDVTVLQVISKDSEPDKVTVEWDGNCGYNHSSYCPSVGVVENDNFKVIDRAQGTAEMPAPKALLVRDLLWVFKVLAMQKDVTRVYRTIDSRLCFDHGCADVGAGQWLQIQAFPEVSWKADVTLGYSHKNAKGADGKTKPLVYEEEATWDFGGSFDATYGANKFKLDGSMGMKSDAFPLVGDLLKKVGFLSTVFDSMATFGADVKLTPRWPKWKIGGGGLKLVELEGKPLVGTEGSFEFGFDPLIGLELEVSILDWVIRFAGGLAGPPGAILAQALVQVRQRFAKGVGGKDSFGQASLDLDIALTVGGGVDAGFGVKFKDGKSETDSEATKISGELDVRVEGHIIGKARAGRKWIVEAVAAGKVGAGAADGKEPSKLTAKLSPKEKSKDPLAAKFQLDWNGLAFYYLLYVEVGAGGGESGEDADGEAEMSWKPSIKSTLIEKKGVTVLIKPWTWPHDAPG